MGYTFLDIGRAFKANNTWHTKHDWLAAGPSVADGNNMENAFYNTVEYLRLRFQKYLYFEGYLNFRGLNIFHELKYNNQQHFNMQLILYWGYFDQDGVIWLFSQWSK